MEKKLMFDSIILFIFLSTLSFAEDIVIHSLEPGMMDNRGMGMYKNEKYLFPIFSISYPLITNDMKMGNINYPAKKSWSFMFESGLTKNEFINLGIGVMYTEQFRLLTLSSYTTYSTPDTYKFVPIYMIADVSLSPYTAFVFKLGVGNVKANNEFITEFGDIVSTGYYYAGGIRFLSLEILYSIDSLKLSKGVKVNNNKISLVF
ncbi:hypothetical protein EV215_0199 [Hypnocyclicus thermotrophus]|uniref:Uncharacterized protein n=1 Tax=Hypnocyclicus thermotrophus TaxID=1627895 RepID=A0AA46I783_9FUSO|nr:hypothetical protein [Hypnocyclicus thermotrophus]TDT72398.1 hypothetical protein EV215_0199 [Hypnocyclicus thermotrophus]